MRIISGSLGGRQFDSPKGHRTHPMSDKVRGGLFNSLGDIEGLTLLDAFAGSGAICFEAISRGSSNAIAVEIDKGAHTTIKQNIEKLDLTDQVKVIRANVSSWSDQNSDQKFDLVICDPPYDQIKPALLEKLATHVRPNGLMVISHPPDANVELSATSYQLLASKNYGDASLAFYRKTE